MNNILKLEKDEANKIVWGEHPDWEMVPETEEGGDVHKQMQDFEAIFEHKPTGKFYSTDWYVLHDEWGCEPFEYTDPIFIEVEKVVTTIVTETWRAIDND